MTNDRQREMMNERSHISWDRRAGGAVCVFYLLVFLLVEVYSAAATAFDRNTRLPSWEPLLGWGLFVLPCVLLISLFLLHGRYARLGFYLVAANLCLYASFMTFEWFVSRGNAPSHRADWEVAGIWATLFATALLAARFLKMKAQACNS